LLELVFSSLSLQWTSGSQRQPKATWTWMPNCEPIRGNGNPARFLQICCGWVPSLVSGAIASNYRRVVLHLCTNDLNDGNWPPHQSSRSRYPRRRGCPAGGDRRVGTYSTSQV
jgi:hypothetical protein